MEVLQSHIVALNGLLNLFCRFVFFTFIFQLRIVFGLTINVSIKTLKETL